MISGFKIITANHDEGFFPNCNRIYLTVYAHARFANGELEITGDNLPDNAVAGKCDECSF